MSKSRLPDKLSELIRLAVADCKLVEQDPRYELDMMEWHNPSKFGGSCEVCMAGAIMAKTLEAPIEVAFTASSGRHSDDEADKLLAIDEIRGGNFETALTTLSINCDEHLNEIDKLENYVQDRYNNEDDRADWDTYLYAADKLEEMGY